MPPLSDAIFLFMEDCLEAIKTYASEHGYAIIKKGSCGAITCLGRDQKTSMTIVTILPIKLVSKKLEQR